MRTRILWAGGVLVLAALATLWWLTNYERVPYKERVGPTSEVRLRPFLAAQRFAARMGVPASEIRSVPELDALQAGGVLLMPARRQALEPGRLRAIAGWVDRGGHLIVEAEFPGVPDPLLELLGVERSEADVTGKPLEVDAGGGKLAVRIAGRTVVQPPAGARVLLRTAPASRLVSYQRNWGTVTAAASLDFARNPQIGANDHAALLWELLALNGAQTLQVYHRPERLSLWGFLQQHALEAVSASLALLALWLWRIAPRFGPVAPDAPPARRRLLDHLRASGRYYWAKGLRARLVVAARDAALRRLARAQPDFANASDAEKASRLASLTGIPPEEARRFIAGGGPMHGADFIKLAHYAQRTHAALEKGKK
jgi:hypothetical protein